MLHNRCIKIVYNGEQSNEGSSSLIDTNKVGACILVRDCLIKISAKYLKISLYEAMRTQEIARNM